MAQTFEPDRLQAFSDGVLAVIITIMVLELKVPHESGGAGLRAVLPTLLVYALSFMFVGIYWVNHHELVGRLRRCNNRILWANLLWMFAVSLTPFFTAWMLEDKLQPLSVQLYAGAQLLAGLTFLLLRYAVDCQLEREGRNTQLAFVTRLKHLSSMVVYLAAVLLAPWKPLLALGLTAVVAFLWIVPTLSLPQVDLQRPGDLDSEEDLPGRAHSGPAAINSISE
jgi:uncharacterized membrane protein